MEKFSQNLLRLSLSILFLSFPIGFLFAGFEYLNTKKFLSSKYDELNEKIEDYIEDMEKTYPETIKYFPSTKLADKSPLATLLLTKSKVIIANSLTSSAKFLNETVEITDKDSWFSEPDFKFPNI